MLNLHKSPSFKPPSKNLKIKSKIISHMKIDVPTFKKNNLPKKLKDTPITVPGSRFIK